MGLFTSKLHPCFSTHSCWKKPEPVGAFHAHFFLMDKHFAHFQTAAQLPYSQCAWRIMSPADSFWLFIILLVLIKLQLRDLACSHVQHLTLQIFFYFSLEIGWLFLLMRVPATLDKIMFVPLLRFKQIQIHFSKLDRRTDWKEKMDFSLAAYFIPFSFNTHQFLPFLWLSLILFFFFLF